MSEPEGFWKRHGFLVAGVALPLLVVVGFALARTLPRLWVPAPRFEVLYAVRTGYDAQPRKIDRTLAVADGRLRVVWTRVENQLYPQPLHVYRLQPATGEIREVEVPEPPQGDALDRPADLAVAGLEAFRIDTSPRAPDGYEYETRSADGGGPLGEILGQRYRGPRAAVSKGGRVIVLPRVDGDPYGYTPVQFLGWLVPAEVAR